MPSAVLVALADEESRADGNAVADALRARGIPCEVAPAPQKFGKQIRYAERRGIPFVWFPAADGGTRSRTSGRRQVPADPATWTPPTEDLRPQVTSTSNEEQLVIRTHDAGALRAEHVDQTVTLAGRVARRRDHAGSPSSTCATRAASSRSSSATRRWRTACARVLPRVTGTVALRPEGNANPNLPSGDIEVIADGVEVLGAAAPLPFPIDDAGRTAATGGGPPRHRYLDLRRSGPAPRCGCAARSTRRPATCWTRTASSRSRRRR